MDALTRETLVNVCESVQAQFQYLSAMNNSLVALYEALKTIHPEIEKAYAEAVRPYRDHPGSRDLYEQVGEILQQLRKL
jgi:hypothetical protein